MPELASRFDHTQLDALDRDGWLAVPGVLTPGGCARLVTRCLAVLDEDGDQRQGDKRAGGTRRAGDLLQRVPEVAPIFDHPGVRAAVARLLGSVALPTDVAFRCPQPGFGAQSLHADDLPITSVGECRAVTSIVALCDFVGDNGGTAVVPGSHRRPDLQRRAGKLDLAGSEVVLTGRAGTAFVFSAHLLHRGTLNRSGSDRPALQAQWRPSSWSTSSSSDTPSRFTDDSRPSDAPSNVP